MRKDDERWLILDNGKQISTGLRGRGSEEAAKLEVARYRLRAHTAESETPDSLDALSVQGALGYYIDNLRTDIADPKRQGHAVMALLQFWDGKTCAEVNARNCELYCKTRRSASTARRELGVLRAALNKAHKDGFLPSAPQVHLPPKSIKKPVSLTRDEVARVLLELWRGKRTKHAARFLVCMFYTGSRPGTIARTTWKERSDGPWVDLEDGIWWRAGVEEPETVKMRRPHGIPRRLDAHLRRWRKMMLRETAQGPGRGGKYVIEYPSRPNEPVKDIGGSLERACERAGVRRITPHVLKHTAITNGIRSGMSITEAADYFSTSTQTIEAVYWYRSPHHQKRARDIMDRSGKPQ